MWIAKVAFVLIISGCVVSCLQNNDTESENAKVREYSLYVLDGFEPKADPCNDFDNYICGYWRSVIGTLGLVGSVVNNNIYELLEQYNDTVKMKFDAGNKLKLIYDSCKQYGVEESADYKKQKEILKEIAPFPAFQNNWTSHNFDYIDVIIKFASYKVPTLFEFKTVPSYTKPEEYVFWISPLELTQITNESMKPTSSRYDLSQEILSDIFEFQREIIKKPFPFRKSLELDTKEITYGDLKSRIPNFNWDKYFTNVFGDVLKDTDHLVIQDESYLNFTVNLFKSAEPRVLANFLLSLFMDEYSDIGDQCIQILRQALPDILNALYLQTDHHQLREVELSEFFGELRDSFVDIITQSNWIDENTKAGLVEKVLKIEPILGYHGNKTKLDELDARYEDLNIDANNFLQNYKAIAVRFNKLTMKNLKEQNKDLLPETFDPLQINAGYMEGENRVIFYSGLAHENVYHPSYPKAINFGGYGTFMAHELGHSVDPQCRLFDSQGYRHEWWNKPSVEEYDRRVACLVKQYNTILETPHLENPGLKTIQENFADNVGLRIAFNAYKRWLQKHKDNEKIIENEKLPDFNVTATQLFFIGLGKFRCSGLEFLSSSVKNGYSPSMYRTLGMLQNSNDFAEIFNCPVGSKYNPEKKCIIF